MKKPFLTAEWNPEQLFICTKAFLIANRIKLNNRINSNVFCLLFI